MKRYQQGWVMEISKDLNQCIQRIKTARAEKKAVSIAFHVSSSLQLSERAEKLHQGNVVDLWEKLAAEPELLVDLGSDQTSLHNPFNGGYYPGNPFHSC
jgi:urocanate hydratase